VEPVDQGADVRKKRSFFIALVVIALVILAAFSVVYRWPNSVISTGFPQQAPSMGEIDYSTLVITMEREPCFGVCPAYKLTIHGDGSVVYEGIYYVRVTGTKTLQIPQYKVKELVSDFLSIDYFNLEDSYQGIEMNGEMVRPSTATTTITSITVNGRMKQIESINGALQALDNLENKIDEVAGTADLLGSRDEFWHSFDDELVRVYNPESTSQPELGN
jgi:hypothetical protein